MTEVLKGPFSSESIPDDLFRTRKVVLKEISKEEIEKRARSPP